MARPYALGADISQDAVQHVTSDLTRSFDVIGIEDRLALSTAAIGVHEVRSVGLRIRTAWMRSPVTCSSQGRHVPLVASDQDTRPSSTNANGSG